VTLAARGADFFDSEAIGLHRIEHALSRVIKRSQSEIEGERVLDDLDVTLAGAGSILLTGATDQLDLGSILRADLAGRGVSIYFR